MLQSIAPARRRTVSAAFFVYALFSCQQLADRRVWDPGFFRQFVPRDI